MNKKTVGVTAGEYFESGFNCAESVSLTIAEAFQMDSDTDIPSVASFFGGGFGSTHQEICGAISGAVLGVGLLFGRQEADKNIDEHKEIIKEVLDQFNQKYATTNCGKLTENLNEGEQKHKCTTIVKEIAETVFEKIQQRIEP